ncbi:hypothetical protein FRB93_011588 [Tulasnella sp. JGI-2019a]|nr:hypothetical protein FRB93_011588 [Tulasnella sp. JGI-2019a]
MPFYITRLIYVGLLMINAIAVLSEDRFLARIGWSSNQPVAPSYDQSGFGEQGLPNVKARLINLISAIRTLMRIPLIAINITIIMYELALG